MGVGVADDLQSRERPDGRAQNDAPPIGRWLRALFRSGLPRAAKSAEWYDGSVV